MKKGVIIVVVLLILYFLFKPKKTGAQVTEETTGEEKKPFYRDDLFEFAEVEPYTIKDGDWLSKFAVSIMDLNHPSNTWTAKGRADLIRDFTISLARMNGFDESLIDSVPSKDPKDPDTLYIGQKILLPTYYSTIKGTYESTL